MHCETLNNPKPAESISEAARERLISVKGEPLLLADWLRLVFIHYEVPAEELQAEVPFEVELFEGKAYVSLVAFSMQRMRPRLGGRLVAWMFKPIACNEYLNVRTYVRHCEEPGIYFMAEWMNNPFSVRLGPSTFGLPYHFGVLNYRNEHETGFLRGAIRDKESERSFAYEAVLAETRLVPCPAGSLDEFLMERYTAFTSHEAKGRFFRIWHAPWLQKKIEISIPHSGLVAAKWPWFANAKLVGGNYSPGARNVWMGRPHRVEM
jgi:uncharacterized protein YqjF (DUF2071 family)